MAERTIQRTGKWWQPCVVDPFGMVCMAERFNNGSWLWRCREEASLWYDDYAPQVAKADRFFFPNQWLMMGSGAGILSALCIYTGSIIFLPFADKEMVEDCPGPRLDFIYESWFSLRKYPWGSIGCICLYILYTLVVSWNPNWILMLPLSVVIIAKMKHIYSVLVCKAYNRLQMMYWYVIPAVPMKRKH